MKFDFPLLSGPLQKLYDENQENFGNKIDFEMSPLVFRQFYVCALSPKNTHIESSQLVSDIKYPNRMNHFHG